MKSCFNYSAFNISRMNNTIYDLTRDLKIDNYTNLQSSRALVYVGTADK